MNKEIIAKELVRIAKFLLAEDYQYKYDPKHENRPDGNWEKTEKGWEKGKSDKQEVKEDGKGEEKPKEEKKSPSMDYGDPKENLQELKKLHVDFAKRYKDVFPNFKIEQNPEMFTDTNSSSYLTSTIPLNLTEKEQNRMGIKGDSVKCGFFLTSDINPNGITSKGEVARTYNISCSLYGQTRGTQRQWSGRWDGNILGKYCYGKTLEETFQKMDDWIEHQYKPIVQSIEDKTFHSGWNRRRME